MISSKWESCSTNCIISEKCVSFIVCLLLRHLTLATNSFGGLIFEYEVKNKYISVFIYEP